MLPGGQGVGSACAVRCALRGLLVAWLAWSCDAPAHVAQPDSEPSPRAAPPNIRAVVAVEAAGWITTKASKAMDAQAIERVLDAVPRRWRQRARRHQERFGRWLLPREPEVLDALARHMDGHGRLRVLRPRRAWAGPVVAHNLESAQASGIDALTPGGESGLGLTGEGVLLGLWDLGGVRVSHRALRARAVNQEAILPLDHATHVAGTLMADGSVDPAIRGMAPQARLWAHHWSYDGVELLEEGRLLAVSNHSYGPSMGWDVNAACPSLPIWMGQAEVREDAAFGKYDVAAADIDRAVRATDLAVVWSAGNERGDFGAAPGSRHLHFPSCHAVFQDTHARERDLQYDTLGGYAVAKNVLTVGSVSAATDPPTLSGFSGFGPCDDGRIKPELVAAGESVRSTFASHDDASGTLSGTSSAAPVVAGGLALLVERIRQTQQRDPTAAELRALAVHAARSIDDVPGPSYRDGWGVFDARAAVEAIEADASSTADARRIRHGVTKGEVECFATASALQPGTPLRATLAWNDPPARPNDGGVDHPAAALEHDLDLSWVAPSGEVFHPWSLNREEPAAAATRAAPNRVDSLERVDVPETENTQAGVWQACVRLHGGLTREQAQPFALVASVPLAPASRPRLGARRHVHVRVGAAPVQRVLSIRNLGAGNLAWTASSPASWLALEPLRDDEPQALRLTIDPTQLDDASEHETRIVVHSRDPAGPFHIAVRVARACEPACESRECGLDPSCGERCGRCEAGSACTEDGSCVVLADACPSAELGAVQQAIARGSTAGASDVSDASCGGQGAPERGFHWQAPADGLYRFSTRGSDFDTLLHVRRDGCDGQELACNDDTNDLSSALGMVLQQGERVTAVVDGYDGAAGDFTLHIEPAPCPDAHLGSALGDAVARGDLTQAVDDLTGSCTSRGLPDAAFAWTAPVAGRYLFRASRSRRPVALFVREDACTGPELGCAAAGGDGNVEVELEQGETVVAVLDGRAHADAGFVLDIHSLDAGCMQACGGPAANGLCHCDAECVKVGDCCLDACAACGVCDCEPRCDGKSCGPDGCGGRCGTCDDGDACTRDRCVAGQCRHEERDACSATVTARASGAPLRRKASREVELPAARAAPAPARPSEVGSTPADADGCRIGGAPAPWSWVWLGVWLMLVARRRRATCPSRPGCHGGQIHQES